MNRQSLADCAIGFGRNAMGGKGAQYYAVTDSSDEGPVNPTTGTLKYAVIQTEPLQIIFQSDMFIQLKEELVMNSHKTIDGRGAEIHTGQGPCITIKHVSNIIIHGVHIHVCVPGGQSHGETPRCITAGDRSPMAMVFPSRGPPTFGLTTSNSRIAETASSRRLLPPRPSPLLSLPQQGDGTRPQRQRRGGRNNNASNHSLPLFRRTACPKNAPSYQSGQKRIQPCATVQEILFWQMQYFVTFSHLLVEVPHGLGIEARVMRLKNDVRLDKDSGCWKTTSKFAKAQRLYSSHRPEGVCLPTVEQAPDFRQQVGRRLYSNDRKALVFQR